MTQPHIFKEAKLPALGEQASMVDADTERLLVGSAVAKSVFIVMAPAFKDDTEVEWPPAISNIISAMVQFGGPELFRDNETKTIGLNLTAAVIAVRGVRALQRQAFDPIFESEAYRRFANDAVVLTDGVRDLFFAITGTIITPTIESLEE